MHVVETGSYADGADPPVRSRGRHPFHRVLRRNTDRSHHGRHRTRPHRRGRSSLRRTRPRSLGDSTRRAPHDPRGRQTRPRRERPDAVRPHDPTGSRWVTDHDRHLFGAGTRENTARCTTGRCHLRLDGMAAVMMGTIAEPDEQPLRRVARPARQSLRHVETRGGPRAERTSVCRVR